MPVPEVADIGIMGTSLKWYLFKNSETSVCINSSHSPSTRSTLFNATIPVLTPKNWSKLIRELKHNNKNFQKFSKSKGGGYSIYTYSNKIFSALQIYFNIK